MNIEELNLSDLKAAYDFVKVDLADLEHNAREKKTSADKIPAYREVKSVESKLYDRLLNMTRGLK